jgi:hypothetical protein
MLAGNDCTTPLAASKAQVSPNDTERATHTVPFR